MTGIHKATLLFCALLMATCTACGGSGKDTVCADTTCLNDALSEAQAGDSIQLEAGTYESSITVPPGVSLIGAGESTILKFDGDAPVITVSASGEGASLSNLSIEKNSCPYNEDPASDDSSGGGGLVIEGDGAVTLTDLKVDVACGLGILVRDAASLSAQNLTLTGNVTVEDEPGMPSLPNRTVYALAGLAVDDVGQATLSNIDASGFAVVGVLLNETGAEWDGGEVYELVGTGIHVSGMVTVILKNITVHDIWGGATPFGYGIAATDDVHLVTENVTVEDNKVAGILMDHATGEHTGLNVKRNGERGIWIQNCAPIERALGATSVAIHGQGTLFDENYGVAVGIFKSSGVSIADAQIMNTQKIAMVAYENTVRVDIGDGIEIIQSDDMEFTDLSVLDNARAGIVVDARGTDDPVDVVFDSVEIDGDGERGYAVQDGVTTSDPDVIDTTLQDNDALGGFLDVASPFEPGLLPTFVGIIDIET